MSPDAFRALEEFELHRVLEGVPLHDVWRIDLPGGGEGRTVRELRELLAFDALTQLNPVVRGLFRLRGWLGSLFGWDEDHGVTAAGASRSTPTLARVPQELLDRSVDPPGTPDGPFRLLYALERESVSEIANATVHAFSAFALEARPDGYTAYWAIYVAPVGRITALYMALIDPFRRLLVYPAILRHVERSWQQRLEQGPGAVP